MAHELDYDYGCEEEAEDRSMTSLPGQNGNKTEASANVTVSVVVDNGDIEYTVAEAVFRHISADIGRMEALRKRVENHVEERIGKEVERLATEAKVQLPGLFHSKGDLMSLPEYAHARAGQYLQERVGRSDGKLRMSGDDYNSTSRLEYLVDAAIRPAVDRAFSEWKESMTALVREEVKKAIGLKLGEAVDSGLLKKLL